jgi:septal ring factor EnvC (AmiA/AmiB activator)
MSLDMNITMANMLTILVMAVAVIVAFMKFRDDVNKKVNKEEFDRMRGNLDALCIEVKSASKKLDEIKKDLKEYVEKQEQVNKDFWIIKSDHGRNHK